MKFTWFTAALLALASSVSSEAASAPEDLVVKTTFQPSSCPHKAKTGDKISMHYTGKLFSNGNKFDSSYDRGSPLPLTLGVGQVIPGWDQGLQGMCQGEKRTLTIPSHLAYGSRGFGQVIPPHSTLVFDVELVELSVTDDRDEL